MKMLLQSLFEETKNNSISKKDKKYMSRSCKYIKNYRLLPEFNCPEPDSEIHKKDMEELLSCYHNPSLPKSFLDKSHSKMNKLFKDYCKDNNLFPDWKKIKNYTKDLHTITSHLKHKYNRPRPKKFLDNEYDEIIDMFSPSFPSGHTATAYFLSEFLSTLFSSHRQEFMKLAGLIGRSRIENGVHFPSDVLYGRFIGETLAKLALQEGQHEDLIDINFDKNDEKKLRNYLLEKFNNPKDLCYQLADFIQQTNSIENIKIDYEICLDACKNFLNGYPIEKCTKNKDIRNQFNLLSIAKKIHPVDSPYKIILIHKMFDKFCLDKGEPGILRLNKSYAKNHGNEYSAPENIIRFLEGLNYQKNEFVKHILFEWIHPFDDGNGRLGRILLLIDSDFDFNNVNNFCGNKYLDYITGYIDHFKELNSILGV